MLELGQLYLEPGIIATSTSKIDMIEQKEGTASARIVLDMI